VTTIDSLLFVLDPKDVDEELLKQPNTLPTEEDDKAGDGGGVPTFPKQLHSIIITCGLYGSTGLQPCGGSDS